MKKLIAGLFAMVVVAACGGSDNSSTPIPDSTDRHPTMLDAGMVQVPMMDAGKDASATLSDAGPPTPTCLHETDGLFCIEAGATCGAVMGLDNCGDVRTVLSCGACVASQFCNAGACSATPCVPESDAALCSTGNKDCGVPSLVDNCGMIRTPNCGPSDCGKGSACTNNKCVACVPKTCAVGACGPMSDGCNPAPLDCGGCNGNDTCVNNTCKTLYSQLCSAPANQKVFLGSCTYWDYQVDAAACTATLIGAAVDDYIDNYTGKPDTAHKNSCLNNGGASGGVITYNCITPPGKTGTYVGTTWSDTQVAHDQSRGGCESDAATTNGALVLCSEYTHWYGAPDTVASVKASCVAPLIYLVP